MEAVTQAAVMSYPRSAILPALGQLRVDSVVRADVARFFHEYGQLKSGGANRCHEILQPMFGRAIARGHRPEAAGNLCHGIARYRRTARVGYCSPLNASVWSGFAMPCTIEIPI